MSTSQLQASLRKYVEDGIQQKVRLNNLILDYEAQETKTRERIIDQNELQVDLENEGIDPEKRNLVSDRTQRDTDILKRVQTVLATSKDEISGLTLRMNAHLEELTQIEVSAGGFVTHAIGVDQNATLDKDNMIVKFKAGGHVEIPIAARMNKWKDSSQLTIKKINKK